MESCESSKPFPCTGELTCTPFFKLVDLVNEIFRHREEADGLYIARTCVIRQLGPDWRSTLRILGEQLSALDANHIFYAFDKWHQAGTGAEQKQIQHPLWQSLPAVQNNRAYHVDFMTWMNHGVIANSKKIDEVIRFLA